MKEVDRALELTIDLSNRPSLKLPELTEQVERYFKEKKVKKTSLFIDYRPGKEKAFIRKWDSDESWTELKPEDLNF